MSKLMGMCVGAIALMAAAVQADEVTLAPAKDATLYENATGSLANGEGSYLFTGRTAQTTGSIRRALLAFDIEANVPAASQVSSASLTLGMNRTIAGATDVSLHRVTSDWGEGASDDTGQEGTGTAPASNDATWIHTFFDTDEWTTPGGDYEATASATTSVGGVGFYVWESPGMVTDVQAWVDDPATNFGWILIGDEGSATTAKRFSSVQNLTVDNRPSLTIVFTPPSTVTGWQLYH